MYEYDRAADRIVGPHNQIQVIMARGLTASWKQPVFIDFDKKLTADILYSVIISLQEAGYQVVACVGDCGGGNLGLWKELGISVTKSHFSHPVLMECNIYYFPDAPHLLKLLRNWLLDSEFSWPSGLIVNKKPIVDIINTVSSTEVRSCHRLSVLHVTCEKTQRQKVRLAAELLSHTTATAIRKYSSLDCAQATADFIESINSWFDLMNTYVPNKHLSVIRPSKCAYGLALMAQNKILDSLLETITEMRCSGKTTLQVFQKGIIISINSTKELHSYLNKKYSNVEYILTHKLNQDCLEIFFSQIRTRGGLNDHPTPINTLNRIRMIVAGKSPGVVQAGQNPLDNDIASEEYIVSDVLKTAGIITKAENICEAEDADCIPDTQQLLTDETEVLEECTEDGLRYLGGWIAKKFMHQFSDLGGHSHKTKILNTSSWIQHLSYGGLVEPSDAFMHKVKKMEFCFQQCLGQKFKIRHGIVKKITNNIISQISDIPAAVVKTFVTQRIFIRLKFLNRSIYENSMKKRKSSTKNSDPQAKKIKKFVT